MRQRSSLRVIVLAILLGALPTGTALADVGGSVADSSNWNITSYQVNLIDHRGGSGDIQTDQNEWIYLGANHLEGGDIKYTVDVGGLAREDIVEVWIDGYSTSTDLNVGPTVFIGTGKNRYEQITRMTGDAWRPFVFRFADDALYGDVTDPSNRNANWRTRYPSSKYEIRRIDKAPADLLDETASLPIRVSVTGVDDFILKRMEVVVYRSTTAPGGVKGLYIVKLSPYAVRSGERVTVTLSQRVAPEDYQFFVIDPDGREYKVATQSLGGSSSDVSFYADDYYFPRSGEYQLKLVDAGGHEDIERLEYTGYRARKIVEEPKPVATPPILSPEIECGPGMVGTGCLPPVPAVTAPMQNVPAPYIVPGTAPYGQNPYQYGGPPVVMTPQPQPQYQQYGGYTIQVGAFASRASAAALQNSLQRQGFDAYISQASQGGKALYRVRVGRFPNKSAASQEAQRLRRNGVPDTWITSMN